MADEAPVTEAPATDGAATGSPVVEGWFTTGPEPRLVGLACSTCSTVVFPPRALACPNPRCDGTEFERRELSRTGRVWSYTTNHYAPPEPYISPDPFEPYSVAAVELDGDRLIVLGQLEGEVEVGSAVELVVGELADGALAWTWRATGG